ncbi:hypothetical protein GIB67_005954 [Kingdonia uniflora]|uniref:MYB transcription factor n=1 Tax=Kingdonia uniflora TaxID=39325 RepID=A0A7J7MBY9_9MAGN|nr:hypothetical protein GIB67_005954 [Kingdonia uniflora]
MSPDRTSKREEQNIISSSKRVKEKIRVRVRVSMGAPKQKWTSEEEEALKAGIEKHGAGKWKTIQTDPEFSNVLAARSNIDLKDKWRNMSVSASGQGSREKVKTPKLKALPPPVTWTPQNPTSSSAPVLHDASVDTLMESPKSVSEGKNGSRHNTMNLILEAISNMKDPNGSDFAAINGYIQQRYEVQENFKRMLSTKLRRLVGSKLEKVGNCYKILKDVTFGTRTPTPKLREIRPKLSQEPGISSFEEAVEEAAKTAAYKIAEAENKSFLAAEAVKEAERVSKLSADTDALLQLFQEIQEQCSRGEIVEMAPNCGLEVQ